jgi:peptidoglycan hydrolase-like protein with peptidoglycan-binding domain
MALKVKSYGEAVTNLQKNLNLIGYPVPESGTFCNETFKAVKKFQRDNGITVTGIVAQTTYDKILKKTLQLLDEGCRIVEQ